MERNYPRMQRIRSEVYAVIIILAAALGVAQAQVAWTTTKTSINSHDFGNCGLLRNALKVKVHPDHLDVEEEAQIGTTGTVRPGNDPNTLEIVATFRLPPGAAMVGALLWDGDRILEGKLLDRKQADSLYERVVQRDSIIPPPRPRDPILLEALGNDLYRFKVYPVSLNFSRRMRLRYQLPGKLGPDGFEIRVQAAMAPLFASAPALPVNFFPGAEKNIVLAEGAVKRQLTLPRSVFVQPSNLGPFSPAPVRVLPVERADQVAARTAFSAGYFTGHYLNLLATVPQSLLASAGARTRTVSVTLRNGARAYDLPIACQATPSIVCGHLVFHGKSAEPWSDTLEWQAFDANGQFLQRLRMRPRSWNRAGDTGIAVTWAAAAGRFSEFRELPAGPAYGFVDAWASLLALEKDSIVGARKLAYADSGVPRIVNDKITDVLPNWEQGKLPPGSGGTPIVDRRQESALADASAWKVERVSGGGLALRVPGLNAGMVEVTLFDLGGRSFGTWRITAADGLLRFPSGIRPGTYLLQLRIGGKLQGVKKVVL